MATRSQCLYRYVGPFKKKLIYTVSFSLIKRRETWKRRTQIAVKRRWNSPDSAVSIGEFFQLVRIILFHAVWWISYDRVDAICRNFGEPCKAVGMND